MPRAPKPPDYWYREAATKVVRNNLSLRQAAQELDIPLTLEDADRISKQKAWMDILWDERHKFQTEVAQAPGATQTSLIGLSYLLIQELVKAGEYDRALDGILKLARLRGWDKSNEINIFAGITSADIELQKKAIEKELLDASSPKPAESSLPN